MPSQTISPTGQFYQVLGEIRESSFSERDKGARFEELMVEFFRHDPVYKNRFSQVKLWDDWFPGQGDYGIDIVAEQSEGELCAIQCKFYDEKYRIAKKDIEPLIAAANPTDYAARIFVHTAASVTENVQKVIDGQVPNIEVIDRGRLADSKVYWPGFSEKPASLRNTTKKFIPGDHQKEAIQSVTSAFKGNYKGAQEAVEKGMVHDRGKMIMACGTGKTFTALKIAEQMAGEGGTCLYLVPSISLLQQTMREWAEQADMEHKYIGICSDTKAGKTEENQNLFELETPVTTNPKKIASVLAQPRPNCMRVVFCTYQSIELVHLAQREHDFTFDIILADEAHRTTGIEKLEGDDEKSYFLKVHDNDYIRADKRLYMTATERIYAQHLKVRAGEKNLGLFSMNDPGTYGEIFYELKFGEAIKQDLLSDYRVVIIEVDENYAAQILEGSPHLIEMGGKLFDTDTVGKIIGAAKALRHRGEIEEYTEGLSEEEKHKNEIEARRPLKKAIAFANTIKYSQTIEKTFAEVANQLESEVTDEDKHLSSSGTNDLLSIDFLSFNLEHVDGKTNALNRKLSLNWLKEGGGQDDHTARILTNARCLTEGIDVPALDAAIFMSPRTSYIDIIQAVGRVMRKAENKEYGYIILPVIVPSGLSKDEIYKELNGSKYSVIWRVLQALRSHDEDLNMEIESLRFGGKSKKIIIGGVSDPNADDPDNDEVVVQGILNMPSTDFIDAIQAIAIDKVGDRFYWKQWAEDIAQLASRNISSIKRLMQNEEETAKEFERFLKALRTVVSETLTEEEAIEMLAQHMITLPVFEALFGDYDFASNNSISASMSKMVGRLVDSGLHSETEGKLNNFYESVRNRAKAATTAEARSQLVKDLYEDFFQKGFKKTTERLGLSIPPNEVVDFIIHSAEAVLQKEFGKSLSDEGVNILDPFTGTGTFITRLLESGIIQAKDLQRKYQKELFAYEIVLLAYYIADISIEQTYNSLLPEGSPYEEFDNILLRDTFLARDTGRGEQQSLDGEYFQESTKQAIEQDKTDIQVIIGNPPYSIGQKTASHENANKNYPRLANKVSVTYAKKSTAVSQKSLYDSYVLAIRWASDQIADKGGVVAFVTNGSWLDSGGATGIRACFKEEFSSIYCFNLRGNTRGIGEYVKKEGGKIFGQGSRATVTIVILVNNLDKKNQACKIYYKDIGDYLSREEKLECISEFHSVDGIEDWEEIIPDDNNDWLNKRDANFYKYRAIGDKLVRKNKSTDSIFKVFSLGVASNRDSWAYNSSKIKVAETARKAVHIFNEQLENDKIKNPEQNLNVIKWHRESLKQLLVLYNSNRKAQYTDKSIRKVLYRPFFKQWFHYDIVFNSTHYQLDKIFPLVDFKNLTINISGNSAQKFSSITSNLIPDLHLEASGGQTFSRFTGSNSAIAMTGGGQYELLGINDQLSPDIQVQSNGQVFPRFSYRKAGEKAKGGIFEDAIDVPEGYILEDNILDEALTEYHTYYGDIEIHKDDIFFYVYAMLHHKGYRKKYANNLVKEFPRIPMTPDIEDFWEFAKAGQRLGYLHAFYEELVGYPLGMDYVLHFDENNDNHYRFEKIKYINKESKTEIQINDYLTLIDIPKEAQEYQVNGRSALDWIVDRYQIKTDTKESGITNDPNDLFEDPRDFIQLIKQVTQVSVETVEIVNSLPEQFEPK